MTDSKKIDQIIVDKESQELKEIQRINFLELKNQAKNFLSQINKWKNDFFHQATFQEVYKVFKSDLGKKANEDFMQKCFRAAEELEDKLNHFLNREIFFTWVNTKGQILFYDSIEAQNIHSTLFSSGTNNAKGQYRVPDASKAITEFRYDLLNIMKDKVENSSKNRGQVYRQALKRHRQKSKEEDKENGMAYKNNKQFKNTFWWRTKNWPYINWYINKGQYKTYNEGHIAQAYASAIINNRKNFNNLVDLDISLKNLFELIGVDQVAAIIKGDVKLKQDGRFQFQVKSAGSSSAALGQYIALAYYIIYKKDLTPEQLSKKLIKMQKANHNRAQLILADLFDFSLKELKEKWQEIDSVVAINVLT